MVGEIRVDPERYWKGPYRRIWESYVQHGQEGFTLCQHVKSQKAAGLFEQESIPVEIPVWFAWKPEYIRCQACAIRFGTVEGEEENYRCDACRSLVDDMNTGVSFIGASKTGLSMPIAIHYGLCKTCTIASGLEWPFD
jgi:hypothetical protein